jgi:hypothetical protein
MVRRRRLNAYVGCPVAPMLARMLAREVDGTDFRLMGPQLSSRNPEENANCRGFSPKDRSGGLPVNDEHVPHPMHAHTPMVRVELEQRISTFGVAA